MVDWRGGATHGLVVTLPLAPCPLPPKILLENSHIYIIGPSKHVYGCEIC